jgi:uncharacterized protein (DUF2147 family)
MTMFRLCAARATRFVVLATVLTVCSQEAGTFTTGALASSKKPAATPKAATTSRPVTGKVQTVSKNAITLTQVGTKKVTRIQINAGTQYIVKGKHVAKVPSFTRGLLISVVTTQSKGSYTAQIVIVGPTAPPAPGAVSAPPPSEATGQSSATTTISGVVTLASPASVTLKTSTGTETIKLTTATRYLVKGKQSPSRPTLHAGEKVKIVAARANGMLVGQVFTVL